MAGIPQVITEDRASGAQFIDGSLKFDSSKLQYLTRTPTTAGNRGNWTWSCWCKRGEGGVALFAAYSSDADRDVIRYGGTAVDSLDAQLRDGTNRGIYTTSKFRDTGWYHNVVTYDSSVGVKIYVNGVEQPKSNASGGNDTLQSQINNNVEQYIGARKSGGNIEVGWDGHMSQVYFLDGLALGPGYFGFTDPLTNTWRPKKFRAEGTTVNDGTQWSSLVDVSNATVNNGSAANLFDGDITTKINITGGYIEIDLSSRNAQAGPQGIEVYNNEGGAYTSYQVNGGTAVNWQASAGWMSMGGANSKINTIRINHLSGGGVNAA